MHRTDGDGNVAGLFVPGDPVMGQVATEVKADWLNDVQEEICNVITGAGIALVKGTQTQLRAAIEQKINTIINTRASYDSEALLNVAGSAWTGTARVGSKIDNNVHLTGTREIVNGAGVTAGQLAGAVARVPSFYTPGANIQLSAVILAENSGVYRAQAVALQVDIGTRDMVLRGYDATALLAGGMTRVSIGLTGLYWIGGPNP